MKFFFLFQLRNNYSIFLNRPLQVFTLNAKLISHLKVNYKHELLNYKLRKLTYVKKKKKKSYHNCDEKKYITTLNETVNLNENNSDIKKDSILKYTPDNHIKDNIIKEELYRENNEKEKEEIKKSNVDENKNVNINDKNEQNKDCYNKLLIESCCHIDKDVKKCLLEIFQYKEFTDVQRIVYNNIIKEKKENDLLIQAKTGTGKTIAYLLLSINDIIKNKILSVHTLIIVPTRELANQIYNECKLLLTYKHNINVLTLTGGIKRRDDQLNIRRVKPDIIICTVGRLLDHFESTYLFNTLFENLKMLIIDEADQLLSSGYENDIHRLLTYLPSNRRNILLSATLGYNLDEIRKKMCKSDYIYLNCVKDISKHTSDQLRQYVLFHKAIDTTIILYNLLIEHMRLNQFTYKIIVFFPTARATSFYAQFFINQLKMSVYEIHRKKEPAHRQITSNRFSMESVGILFTSDISSRGLNYPDITLIIQVNTPISREQYIHRVGRTARSNKKGMAIILLNEADELFYQEIKDLNIQKLNAQNYTLKNTNLSNYLSTWMSNTQLLYLAYAYYSSILRFYKTKYTHLKINDDEIIDAVNNMLLSTGLVEQPYISKNLATTLNMQNNVKLKIRKDLDDILLL
ncbi:DEAD box helicase, putative [Plasmodium sp. DRC-Itaito]|nr:DEAD box helicase, putative [Plasmodium sp. DRC-Itaito]